MRVLSAPVDDLPAEAPLRVMVPRSKAQNPQRIQPMRVSCRSRPWPVMGELYVTGGVVHYLPFV